MKIRIFAWEDAALTALLLAWLTVGAGMALFHLYTVGLMMFIFSIGLSRGFFAAVSRVVLISIVLLSVPLWRGQPHTDHLADVSSMLMCAVLSGFLGDRERRAKETLKKSFAQTLEALAHALEARDPYTEGHSRRTAQIALLIARQLGVDARERTAIEQAGLLHDLGKIGTPDNVLRKNGSLTPKERLLMEQHPTVGGQILKGVSFLEEAAVLVRHHHEHYDGSGYPEGLAGSKIPIGARILSVADVLDALTTDRPYHQALDFESAVRQMKGVMAHLFDPVVLGALDGIEFQGFIAQLSGTHRVLASEGDKKAASRQPKETIP